jgi:hypothetical protein
MGFKDETWPLLQMTFWHCIGAIGVTGFFYGTAIVVHLMWPSGFLGWWIDKVETILVVLVTASLAVLLLNTLARLVADAIKTTWKGFLNVASFAVFAS